MTKSVTFDFNKPEENLGYLLWQTTMRWQRLMNRALEDIGLTHTQFVILAALGWLLKQNDYVTQKDIAEHSNTDRMMVSKILRKLQADGLVIRREHEKDTRAKIVEITDEGIEILQKAIAIKTQANEGFFEKIDNKSRFRTELENLIS
ncbi:MarR family winged helix-turn-helix transcriptional regulator [Kangiella shandongensis]|uniref:MarR family winged helix-turn-helix transcriptional regulator n=1 Tax=Kangiella shandongensis TaxID=2763258 RepID=UPI001CBD8345|nr:MarR family transcriptional regulator [Kangiella shandongensis]